MIDYHPTLIKALKEIGLPVHYEMTLHSGLATPCISYMELTNYVSTQTDITDISIIQYQVKVWANDISLIQKYAGLVDEKLRSLNWKRVSSNELYDNNSSMIQKVMTYEATSLETL